MKKGKKKQWLIVLVLTVAVIAMTCVGGWKHAQKTAFSLTINGTQISKEEYIQCMNLVQYNTMVTLRSEKHDVSEDELWTTTYKNGKTGYEYLAQQTVEQLKYMHAVYDIAKDKGYIKDATYEGMLNRMEQENQSRSEKIEKGETVYGLKEYSTEMYQDYELNYLQETYMNDKSNEDMNFTEEEIQKHYDNDDWFVGEEAREVDLSEARAAVIDELRRAKYEEMTEEKAKVAEVDGDMDALSQFTLKEMIRQTIFSIAVNENNRLMTGELFEIKDNCLKIVSLDGHRISIRKMPLKKEYSDRKIVVPGKTLSEISKILSGEIDDQVSIYFTKNHILFEFDQTMVVSRLIEGEYFRIDQMLSSDYETKVKINKREFLDCIDRATLFVKEGDKKPIIITIDDTGMQLNINSQMGSMNEEIDIDKEGKDIMIGFNPKFLIDALKVIDDEEISIYLVNPKAPCFIKNEEESYIYLILPVNFNTAR